MIIMGKKRKKKASKVNYFYHLRLFNKITIIINNPQTKLEQNNDMLHQFPVQFPSTET